MVDNQTVAASQREGDLLWCWGCMSTVAYQDDPEKSPLIAHCDCTKRSGSESVWYQWSEMDTVGAPV